jgi:hypothetical protein
MDDHPEYVDVWNNYKRTHNDYLQVLGEMGLFGFITMILTIILLLILFFKALKKLEKTDDFYLLCAFAACFISILGHSVTEFPLQMLPNQLWAIAIAGIGFGSYFNRHCIMAKTYSLKRNSWIVVLLVILGVSISTGILKYGSFMAEVYFKEGNTHYNFLSQIESARVDLNNKENDYRALYEQLQNNTGTYSKFDPETYVEGKLANQATAGMSTAALSQLRLKMLSDLDKEKKAEEAKFVTIFTQIDEKKAEYTTLSGVHYDTAKNSFLTSIEKEPAFGKSYFYMALLMTRSERKNRFISEFNGSPADGLTTLKKHFTESTDETEYILPEYRKYLFSEDLAYLSLLVQSGFSFQEVIDSLKLTLWYDVQMNQDALGYFESSFSTFSEKNTYRIMGKTCYQNITALKTLISAYQEWILTHPEQQQSSLGLIALHQKQIETYTAELQKWMDTALYVLPASWHLFPDWEGVYEEYIGMLLKIGTPSEYYTKIKEIVYKRLRAAEYTHIAQKLAVPEELPSIYRYLIQYYYQKNNFQEMVMLAREAIEILKQAYLWNQADLTGNPYLVDTEKDRIEKFLKDYDKLVEEESHYYESMIQYYQNLKAQGNAGTAVLSDWQYNELTGETWENPTIESIIERLMQMMDSKSN